MIIAHRHLEDISCHSWCNSIARNHWRHKFLLLWDRFKVKYV